MAELIYILYTIGQAALLWWGVRLWRVNGRFTLFLLLLPILGLVYDNGVIALGRFIGEGELLRALNQGRFLLHVLVTPMLIAAAVGLAAQARVQWAGKRISQALFGILSVGLIGLGFSEYARFVYEPAWFGNTLRYVDTAVAGPPIPSIVTIIVIIILGVFVWRKSAWPWMCIGGVIMFVGSAIPPSLVGPIVGSGAEVVLMGSLLATARQVQKMKREEG
ncbi:MAG: hypothetical protein DHS20C20_26520 [Ardenticatenaceae bacterium]|nr:MAG: hypothetical protein DHS20C20_26520 [Ardenticatenaceae bacterium]